MPSLRQTGLIALGAALVWSALGTGGVRVWPLALAQGWVLAAGLCWVAAMAREGRLEWRRTALDGPLMAFVALVSIQLALGEGRLARWALDPTPDAISLPVPFLALGTVSRVQTWRSLGLLLTYVAVYVLTVNLVREARDVVRLVRALVILGGGLAFVGLLDYLAGERWLLPWGSSEGRMLGRLAGPFANPDHCASWLGMLALLGLGFLAAHRGGARGRLPLRALGSREAREALTRRYLPAAAVGLMLLALVFTLSRGAAVSLAVTLAVVLALLGALGRVRWGLVVSGAVLAPVLAYASWIGLQPFVVRFAEGQSRWTQLVSSLPMLADFPVLGVGLGAYKDVYFRYQPATLGAGRVYFPYAHNDLAQLVLELGPLGGALFGFALWWIARDLVFAHLLGRATCPVGGGQGELARRHDPFSTGVAVGAIGAVVYLLTHGAFDFSARIPANGMLGAACLGLATVALHTRFERRARLLTVAYRWEPTRRRVASWLLGGATGAFGLTVALLILRPAFVEAWLVPRSARDASVRLEWALRADPHHPGGLARRAEGELALAGAVRDLGLDASGRPVAPEGRRAEAERRARQAAADLRAAISVVPTDPFLHQRLAAAYEALALIDPARAREHEVRALVHLRRAIALAPESPLGYRALVLFGLNRPVPLVSVALAAAPKAVRYDPDLLAEVVARFAEVPLTERQWLALVADSWVERVRLGALLEALGRSDEAAVAYRDAATRASSYEAVPLWFLARLLLDRRRAEEAFGVAERAVSRDPGNPELLALRAEALARIGDPAALEAFRAAVRRAEEIARPPSVDPTPFPLRSKAKGELATDDAERLSQLLAARLGSSGPLRYRMLLAHHLADRKLWEPAGVEWDAILAEAPENAEARFARGEAWQALGNPDRAIEEYRKAVELDPRSSYRSALARLLWDTQQFYQAMNEWRALIQREPENVEALVRLAQAELRHGDRVAAFRTFQAALRLAPDHSVARRELAKLTGALR